MPKLLAHWLEGWRSAGLTNVSLDVARKVLAKRRQDLPAPAMTCGKMRFYSAEAAERILALLNEGRPVAAMAG